MVEEKSGAHSEIGEGGESAHPGVSLREFARQIQVSESAVRKAVAVGRLVKSLGKTAKNKPFIANLDLARSEWTASSRTAVGVRTDVRTEVRSSQASTPASAAAPVPKVTPAPPDQAEPQDDGDPEIEVGGQLVFAKTLIDAQTLATNERARKLKFENDVTEGRLIPMEKVTKEAFEAERIIRENILNLPARIAGELAAESDTGRVHLRLDAALREALNAAADSLLAVVNE